MGRGIDLNADIGEGLHEIDSGLITLVTSATIACGGHAGDETTMLEAAARCVENGVRIGAHPSYPDREGFGRTTIDISSATLRSSLIEQIGSLSRIAASLGTRVSYIKPHGALYNDAASKGDVRMTVLAAAAAFELPVMMLAGAPRVTGNFIREGFIDRNYRQDGSLLPRSEPGALIVDPADGAAQALRLAPDVDSLCVHSDSPGAVELMRAARRALEESGYEIRA